MNKKLLMAAVAALVIGVSSSAWADMPFTQTISFVNGANPNGVFIVEGANYDYQHDLSLATPPLTIPPQEVTFAKLILKFGKDSDNDQEYVWLYAEDTQSWYLGEIDGYQVTDPLVLNSVTLDSLNVDGVLDVTVRVTLNGGCGDVYLKSSTLCGTYVPVPGAALLGVLGLAAARRKLRKA